MVVWDRNIILEVLGSKYIGGAIKSPLADHWRKRVIKDKYLIWRLKFLVSLRWSEEPNFLIKPLDLGKSMDPI